MLSEGELAEGGSSDFFKLRSPSRRVYSYVTVKAFCTKNRVKSTSSLQFHCLLRENPRSLKRENFSVNLPCFSSPPLLQTTRRTAFVNRKNRLRALGLRSERRAFPRRLIRALRGSIKRKVEGTYVRYHWEVERRRHSALVDAGFLGTDVSANVLRPEVGGHQDAGLFFAISLRDEEVELMPASTQFTCVHLRVPTFPCAFDISILSLCTCNSMQVIRVYVFVRRIVQIGESTFSSALYLRSRPSPLSIEFIPLLSGE